MIDIAVWWVNVPEFVTVRNQLLTATPFGLRSWMNPARVCPIDHEERFAGPARSCSGLPSATSDRPAAPTRRCSLFEDLMEDQTAILTGSLQADLFETQMRGYNRRQVEEYVARSKEQIGGLEARLATALDVAERARREASAVREQLEQQEVAFRPAHEEISERLSQILRLAAEEAEQERRRAQLEITRMREQVGVDIEGLLAQARAEADAVLAAAQEEAETEIGHAHDEAQRMLVSSQQEAERTLAQAQEHADRLRAQAERRAGAINGILDQRLAILSEAHGTAVRRLSEIRDTIGGLLVTDAGAALVDVAPVERSYVTDTVGMEGSVFEEAAPDASIGDALAQELAMTDPEQAVRAAALSPESGNVTTPSDDVAPTVDMTRISEATGPEVDAEVGVVTADDVVAADEASRARHAEVGFTGKPRPDRPTS